MFYVHFAFILVHRVICDFMLFQNAARNTVSERREDLYSENSNVFIEVILVSWRSWLRHCATSRKFASSIPDGVTGIFH
jgi:hypothetical protein